MTLLRALPTTCRAIYIGVYIGVYIYARPPTLLPDTRVCLLITSHGSRT